MHIYLIYIENLYVYTVDDMFIHCVLCYNSPYVHHESTLRNPQRGLERVFGMLVCTRKDLFEMNVAEIYCISNKKPFSSQFYGKLRYPVLTTVHRITCPYGSDSTTT